jgi:hypothetical protein
MGGRGGATAGDAGVLREAGSSTVGPPGDWARGVQLILVEVSQAVFIKLGEGTQVVDVAMRNAPVIEGRPLLARVHVNPAAGFTARRLRAVLTVDYGDGTSKQLEDGKTISGRSDPEKLDSTFNFLLAAEDVKPKASLAVAVYESGPAMGAEPTPPPRFPATGSVDLGVKAGRMSLDVVVIPVTGPGGPLADTPARRTRLENELYNFYPVQKVNVRWHEPFKMDARLTSSSTGFATLRDLRTQDGAKPNEYYHLLLAKEDTNFTFSGTSNRAGASASDGARRIAMTVVSGRAVDGNVNTVAHELGHNNGRGHVMACGAAGPDAAYPYPNGDMGVHGFSLTEMAFKSRMRFKELMGYCRPRWISDWMWGKFEERVRIVSGFSQPGGVTLAERSLQAFVGPGERPNWGVVVGQLVDPAAAMSAGSFARLTLDDGTQRRVPVAVQLLSDDVTREIAVNLPADVGVLEAEVFVEGERFVVPVADLPAP